MRMNRVAVLGLGVGMFTMAACADAPTAALAVSPIGLASRTAV
jgi:hypothetical protein